VEEDEPQQLSKSRTDKRQWVPKNEWKTKVPRAKEEMEQGQPHLQEAPEKEPTPEGERPQWKWKEANRTRCGPMPRRIRNPHAAKAAAVKPQMHA
jgi:hypothetical protein